jgi:histidinol phosphatase-like enzyme (inositol monophosphatase family)
VSSLPEPANLIDFVIEIATAAGDITLEYFQTPNLEIEQKADGTPVTLADKKTERFLREQIHARFPDDGIVGEEEADVAGTTGRSWIIDPIDGTKSFTAGVPLYANLVAVVEHGEPILGLINLPALGEMVWATAGGGAFQNSEPCHVSSTADLSEAYVMTSELSYWPAGALERLTIEGISVRTWGDGYGYALVATGRAAAMIDPLANIWDVAPMKVILEEAGGVFTSLAGQRSVAGGSGVGSNGVIHEDLMRLLPEAGRA